MVSVFPGAVGGFERFYLPAADEILLGQLIRQNNMGASDIRTHGKAVSRASLLSRPKLKAADKRR
jgi:hypothetical protein